MKIYSCQGKSFVYYLSLIVVCLCIPVGCAVRQEPSPQADAANGVYPIYLVAREPSTAQIWQISPDRSSSSVVYEVAKSVNRLVGTVFPPEEIEKLQSYLAEQSIPITTTARDLLPRPYIQPMVLSPTGEALTWVEGDIYCVEDSAICFGVQRLMALDLNAGNSNVLLQMPRHADEGLIYVISGGPSWSPSGEHVAVIRGLRGAPVEASLIVVNVSTGQSQEITATIDSAGPIVWSPDNAMVAWPLSRWHTRSSGGAIRLCALHTEECKDIELDGLWVWGWGMDWSPDGKQIVFVAEPGNSDLFSDDARIGLHLFDPGTGLVRDIPVTVDGVLENPRWSPDGQFLAADYRPKLGDFFQSLVVIDPTSGQIVGELPMERAESSWVWGRDSHSILVLVGTDRAQLEVGIFDVRDGSLHTVALPDDLATKQINYLNW